MDIGLFSEGVGGRRAALEEDEDPRTGRVGWEVPEDICGLGVEGQSEAGGAHGAQSAQGGAWSLTAWVWRAGQGCGLYSQHCS